MCHTDYEFIHRMTQNLCGGIPDETITHGFSQRRPIRSVQIPPEVGKSPTDFTDIHRFFLGRFFVTQISQMTQILFSWDFLFIGFHGIYSEVDCWDDYSRIFADATCPVVADTPETGKSPTDFTDIHRFFHRSFCHADFFSSDDTEFIQRYSCGGDYSRIFAEATCPVGADTPELGKRDSTEIP